MYDYLKTLVRDDPEAAVKLRDRLTDFVRTPSRSIRLSELLDDLTEQGFVSRAADLSGASDAKCAEAAMLLNHALSIVVLDELLLDRGVQAVPAVQQEVEEVLQQIYPYADSLPGLISHYDSLVPRNVHDLLILYCLNLGFLQAHSTSHV